MSLARILISIVEDRPIEIDEATRAIIDELLLENFEDERDVVLHVIDRKPVMLHALLHDIVDACDERGLVMALVEILALAKDD